MSKQKSKYQVRYFIEDNVVEEHGYDDPDEAYEEACVFDCDAWHGFDPEEYSLYVEVIDTKTRTRLFWTNSDGEEGADADAVFHFRDE